MQPAACAASHARRTRSRRTRTSVRRVACGRHHGAREGHTSRGSPRKRRWTRRSPPWIGVHGRRIRLAPPAQRHAADDADNHGAQRRRSAAPSILTLPLDPTHRPQQREPARRRAARAVGRRVPALTGGGLHHHRVPPSRRLPFPASRRPTRSSRRATAARKSKRARRARCTQRASSRRVGSSFGRRRTRARSPSRASTALGRSSPDGIRAALG